MKLIKDYKRVRLSTTTSLAIGCAVLAVLWPDWRSELRAQTYSSAISDIITRNFQFDRPTTQAAQNRSQIRQEKQINTSGSSSTGGGASADSYKLSEDNGVFFNAGGSFGDVNTKGGTPGFDLYRRKVSLGFDHRFTNEFTGGLFFNYLSSSSNIAQNLGSFESDIFRFIPYLSLIPFDNAYIDITAGYGYQQNQSTTNNIFGTNSVSDSFGGTEYFGSIDIGKSFNFNSWTFTGYGQGSAIGMNIDKFRESIGGMDVIVGKQYPLSVTTTLGLETTYAWSTSFGVLIPRVFGEWVHEYKNNSQTINSQFQGSSISLISNSNPTRNWGNVGIGVQAVLPHSLSTFINYQSLVMSGATNHIVEGGIRWEF